MDKKKKKSHRHSLERNGVERDGGTTELHAVEEVGEKKGSVPSNLDKSDSTDSHYNLPPLHYAPRQASSTEIPDARAVYEARKKRERMRLGGEDYIPLDDTVRLKDTNAGVSGQRQRLVREDENDLSDEDGEAGRFYSAKSLLTRNEEQRRQQEVEFLKLEQGGNSGEESGGEDGSDEDELARWESDQIRKGVSSQRVICYINHCSCTFL